MSPLECMFVGACVGWIACALCFWLIPTWRVHDIVSLDDDALVSLMKDCGTEWCYRHPELKASYGAALAAGEAIGRAAPRASDDTE